MLLLIQDGQRLFPNAFVSMLVFPTSNHDPLLLKFTLNQESRDERIFSFRYTWLADEEFLEVVDGM